MIPLACAIQVATSGAAVELADQGEAKAILVIADDAPTVVRYAAQELKEHLEAASGAAFEIIPESKAVDHPLRRLYLGQTKAAREAGLPLDSLPRNSFLSKVHDGAFYLVGDDAAGEWTPAEPWKRERGGEAAGTLMAVYDWLDHRLGVRWYWPGATGTEVPQKSRITSGPGRKEWVEPHFVYSQLRFAGSTKAPAEGASLSLQQRSLVEGSRWIRRQRVMRTHPITYGHAYSEYWKRFGESRPDYFAMRLDGVRAPVDHRYQLVQMCVSNPDLWKQIIADWKEKRQEGQIWINGCENDRRAIDPFCSCDACRAWDVPEAKVSVFHNPWHIEYRGEEVIDPYEYVSMSDRYSRFLLALLEEGKKADPEAKVIGYAYSSYSDVPVKTKLNDQVAVIIVPPYVYPFEKGKEGQFRKLWDGWKATGAELTYRPNHTLLGYCYPYTYAGQFGKDFKHAIDHGALATDFDSMIGMWGVQGPDLYVLGRLHARPDLTSEQVLDEYYGAFGEGAEAVRAYFDHWAKVTARCDEAFHREVNGGWAAISRGGHWIFTPETFREGAVLLDRAREALEGDAKRSARVEYLAVWLEQARLAAKAMTLFRRIEGDGGSEALKEEFRQARDELVAFRQKHAEDLIGGDWAFIERLEPWKGWKG